MCSRLIWLDKGQIVMEGTAETVIGHYQEWVRRGEERTLQEHNSQPVDTRLGNARIEIVKVSITDPNGTQKTVFHTGDVMHIRMDYIAHEPVPSPIFGIAIHHNDGTHITGPNTRFGGNKLPTLEKSGTVVYVTPPLPLLEGKYFVTVAVTDWDDTEIFDYHDRQYPFRIDNSDADVAERYGLIAFNGEWLFHGSDFE